MGRGTRENGTLGGRRERRARGVPLALDSARRRFRRARASARLVSARRRCSGESEEGELEEEEREAVAGTAAPERRRLAGGEKKSAMVLGAVGVGGDGAIGSGIGEILAAAVEGGFAQRPGILGAPPILVARSRAEEMDARREDAEREEEWAGTRAARRWNWRHGPRRRRWIRANLAHFAALPCCLRARTEKKLQGLGVASWAGMMFGLANSPWAAQL